ncbi:MAG: hypothetical protein GX589_04810 [Deltaproteobacteria bacterium]|nr:hypothetical protein [Deltaproteobacteria bacterium]
MRYALSLLVAVEAVMAASLVVLLVDNPNSTPVVILLLIVAAAALMWSHNFKYQLEDEQAQRRKGSEPEALRLIKSLHQKLRLPGTFSMQEGRKALYLLTEAFTNWYQRLEVDHKLPFAKRVAAVDEALALAVQHVRSEPRRKTSKLRGLIYRLGRSLGLCVLFVYIRRMQHKIQAAHQHAAEIQRHSNLLQKEIESLRQQLNDSVHQRDQEIQTARRQLELERKKAASRHLQDDQKLKAAQGERVDQERLRNDLGDFLTARQRELAATGQSLPLIDRSSWALLLAGLREIWRLFEEHQAAAKQDSERACRTALAEASTEKSARIELALRLDAALKGKRQERQRRRDIGKRLKRLRATLQQVKQEYAQLTPASADPELLMQLWTEARSEKEPLGGWPAALAQLGASPARPLENLQSFLESFFTSTQDTALLEETLAQAVLHPGGVRLYTALKAPHQSGVRSRLGAATLGALLTHLRERLSCPSPDICSVCTDLLAFSGPLEKHPGLDLAVEALLLLDGTTALQMYPGANPGAQLVNAALSLTRQGLGTKMLALAAQAMRRDPGFYFDYPQEVRMDLAAWLSEDLQTAQSVLSRFLVDTQLAEGIEEEDVLLDIAAQNLPAETTAALALMLRAQPEKSALVLAKRPEALWLVPPELVREIVYAAMQGKIDSSIVSVTALLEDWDLSKSAGEMHSLRASLWGLAQLRSNPPKGNGPEADALLKAVQHCFKRHFNAMQGQPLEELKRRLERSYQALRAALVLK